MPAGLLLTGGASRRMGSAKAAVLFDGAPMGQRAADVLRAVVFPVFEVGPGFTDLPAVADFGTGPLGALAAGWSAILAARANADGGRAADDPGGTAAAVLVLGCDLPLVGVALLRLLADHPATGSVVPVASGRPQTLCARWSASAMDRAACLVAAGERRMSALLASDSDAHLLQPEIGVPVADGPNALDDADTPNQLAALTHLRLPPAGR